MNEQQKVWLEEFQEDTKPETERTIKFLKKVWFLWKIICPSTLIGFGTFFVLHLLLRNGFNASLIASLVLGAAYVIDIYGWVKKDVSSQN